MDVKLGPSQKGCHTLWIFENWMLRRIFGPKRDEVIGSWRKVHNEQFHSLYSSPYIIRMIKSRRIRWVGHVACMNMMINACSILVGKAEGKRPLGRQVGSTVIFEWTIGITGEVINEQ
jgi:hypothetical protein